MFCGCLFAGCFASVLQYFHKTHKTPEKHRKTLENTKTHNTPVRVLREFSKSQNFDCIAQNTFHKTSDICKTLQNTAEHRKTVRKRVYCEITSQNTAKRTQNARKQFENVTKRSQYSRSNTYCAHSVFSPKIR